MQNDGGCALNAIDDQMFRGSDAEQALLAFVAAVAALAGAEGAVQRGLDRLAEGLGVPLSLAIGPEVWTAGQVLPGADGPALTVAGARLDGVPAAASAGCARAADLFLRAAQEARAREQVAQARAAASGEVLFEVTGEGADGPWRSPAAAALWADRPQVRQALAPAIRQALGAPDGAEVRAVVSKAGPAQVFGVAAFPAGRPGLWLIRLIDRSEAEAAAARIDRRDLLLRRLFDLSPVGVVMIDYDTGHIIEANCAFLAFGDWSRDDLIGAPLQGVLAHGQASTVRACLAELRRTGRFGPLEQTLLRPDGSSFPAVVRGLVLAGGLGHQIIWLLIEDVSHQRAALSEVAAVRDEALRARTELHTAVQALPHGFMLLDEDDRIVLVNDQMATVYPELAPAMRPGRRYEDVLRDGVARGVFPEAEGREEEFIQTILQGRRDPMFERLTDLRGGRVMRVIERVTPTGGRVGLRIDVTAERESARRIFDVIEGSRAGTWECDFVTGQNWVNDRWAEMIGWTRAELEPITLHSWQALLHPDDREMTERTMARVMRGETDQSDYVFRLRHRDGHWVWVQSRGHVSRRDAAGNPTRMSGVHVDISDLKATEQRLEHIIEGAEAGTWHHDMRAGLCHVNELWVEMLGHDLDSLGPITDEVWCDMMHPDDWEMLNRNMQERFASRTWQFEDELRLRHRDGHWVWVLSRGRVTIWDAAGQPIATSGVHLDISARKQLELELERERDFLATLMETSVSGIMAVDSEARIVFVNRAVQGILEVPAEALLGQVCDPGALGLYTLDHEPLPFAALPCRLAQATGQVIRDQRLRQKLPDGRIKVLSVNAATLPEAGLAARVVCTITDVTAAAQAEDALRAAMDRAETANRAKSQFLANMSHELRTPLNGVLGMTELLAGTVDDPEKRAMLETIRESGVHLLSIVNDLLDLAKIESGKLTLDVAPLRLTDLAARVEVMHGLAARSKGVALTVECGPGAERLRRADGKRLLQVLHNLVGNAVKFTESGFVAIHIAEDAADPDRVMICVADTGIGMSDDQAAQVFEEFTQADGSITRRFGGTGLGLPIVRRLVGLMAGEVTLSSAEGQGTTVAIVLPMPRCEAVRDAGPGPMPPVLRPGLRALLAEDNPTNRLIMRALLTRLGAEVTLACDGDEAVDQWQPGAFDLVLLDISMPRKDGLTALRELRQKAGGLDLPPVLAVTANAMSADHRLYREAGFADVVTKPVTAEAMRAAIARVQLTIDPLPVR
ncbi:MAG: PAS domain S-box protein [Cypionkella sp.]|nr:PAS domain S-box protein [Cypionkella sp.]